MLDCGLQPPTFTFIVSLSIRQVPFFLTSCTSLVARGCPIGPCTSLSRRTRQARLGRATLVPERRAPMLDLRIARGTLVDGTGAEAAPAAR